MASRVRREQKKNKQSKKRKNTLGDVGLAIINKQIRTLINIGV